jgi:hypothetical protein
MGIEKSHVTTPLNRQVVVQLENLREDIWEAKIVYAQKVHLVGKFRGKHFALEASRKKAEQIADALEETAAQPIPRKARKKKTEEETL